jgi:hypothetical protein
MCDYYDDAVNVALEAWPAVWVGVTEQYVVREKPYEVCKSHLHASDRTDLVNMQNVFACGFIAWGFLLSADVGGNAGDNAVGFVSSSLSFSTRLNTMVIRCPILLHTPPTHYSDPDGEFRRLKPGQAHEVYCHP